MVPIHQRTNVGPLKRLKRLRHLRIGTAAEWDPSLVPYTEAAAEDQEREWANIISELVPQLTDVAFGGFMQSGEDFAFPAHGVWRLTHGQDAQLDVEEHIGSAFIYPCGTG